MSAISLQGISKRYPDHVAVERLDLEVQAGEFMVLVGPSGCGKSTTLRMIAGLEDISEGRLLIADRDVTHAEPHERDIAMVFQSYALYPHMTVYMNMAFGLLRTSKLSRSEVDQRVQEAAGRLQISDLLQRRPNELSGGQRQRVAIGRALVRKPKVFLFDEPLSNLDAKLRTHMRAELERLHAELGITIVYVTHDQVEAMTLGTRIAVMDKGRLRQVGAPMEVYRRPADRFVASFIGSPEMNFLPVPDGMPAARAWLNDRYGSAALQPGAVLGLRPEELSISASAAPDVPLGWSGLVQRVERLGAEAYAQIRLGGGDVLVRTEADAALAPDQSIELTPDLSRLRVFDGSTGAALAAQG
ncbi:ABC transporter ATP-binding protein [Diaphorobacter sp. MNS-0]|uniref:ABC transporter ATP-binding protein n=1 Tax=Diaphorobacter sp. MNS-0 TaxID=2866628 RepID=UPI001C732CD6|nr:sn-glycerol-3-phosphate ABC transporter ATP-binding protein UgpC [Diaphorobacter sp. MNS-0]QYY26120.1 sn-glycerol-3-phosphate ABC transporter ATP-binding protein UgpC [Diaphorobacter sp. MNS-0]